ncbi:rab-GTPase-TBC domain-containing protein [Gorgonomyces haynaldii]|nr:rab-GTPase-TBC domain-containing protein [Gorgonomyces haynaldii]
MKTKEREINCPHFAHKAQFMFIKPLDIHLLGQHTWQDRAGNTHFTLQSKKKDVGLKNLLSFSIPLQLSPEQQYIKSISDYDFRIVLKAVSRNKVFCIAVDESFDKIHTDWNWIEKNLFSKLQEDKTLDQTDALLLRQFEDMSVDIGDPQLAAEMSKLSEIKEGLHTFFPLAVSDVLLAAYPAIYYLSETVVAKGQLLLGRNCLYYTGQRQGQDQTFPKEPRLAMQYKDLTLLEHGQTKKMALDGIVIGVRKERFNFSVQVDRKEVFRVLSSLANAAMNRLIKGAENSLSSSSELFSKNNINTTGDLAVHVTNRGGGLMLRSRDEYHQEEEMQFDVSEQLDFTRLTDSVPERPSATQRQTHVIVRYSHIKTALVNSLPDLDDQIRQMEFRNVFRLSYQETITMEETPCYYVIKSNLQTHTGSLYLSQNFMNFCALGQPITPPIQTTSMLFDVSQDPNIVLTVPYSHLVSVQRQSPTSLGLGKLASSGYLVVSTKNRYEFWLSFNNVKTRDRVCEILLNRIKTVDWNFDDDLIIGGRNGPLGVKEEKKRASVVLDGTHPGVNELLSMPQKPPKQDLLQTGLKFLVEVRERDGSLQSLAVNDKTVIKWAEYFDTHGKDVSIVKDMKQLRDLLQTTSGVPDLYRGDFWMLVSGAWNSRPEKGYYERLLVDNAKRVNPFAEEIEKDVRRSLPEHPAYQDAIGLDALRRVLTAFSWRNPAIGYAQALNIISAVLLLHLREEDAFWMLCVIVERMLPDHYTKTLVGSVVDQAVFTELVQTHLPQLSEHLKKLYLDLSTFSVPWFLCLYLNSVSLNVAVKLLDYFFLEGPKFLFWIAVSVLKVNEEKLIAKGKDDDIFVAIIKDFYARLGATQDTEDETDVQFMTGLPLLNVLLHTANNVLGPLINNESIESLRMKHRLSVVHQMEDTNRKSQIRTLCEQVTLSFDEVGHVYDQVRSLEFIHGEEEENPNGREAKQSLLDKEHEEDLRVRISSLGGWGLVQRYTKKPIEHNPYVKSISLQDFRKVFQITSPFRFDSQTIDNNDQHIPIIDRIYCYCSFQYHFAQRKRLPDPGFIVDLAAMAQALDTLMKQPLHTRLRFLFDLHDLDGDTFLSKQELKALMDSLLEMFQKSSQGSKTHAEHEEESYLKAVSSFLTAALQMGDSKDKDIKLGFNEFLLAILSQSVFVEYFERKWSLKKDGDVVIVSWQKNDNK